MRGKHKRMDYQEGSLPPSISTPRRESGSHVIKEATWLSPVAFNWWFLSLSFSLSFPIVSMVFSNSHTISSFLLLLFLQCMIHHGSQCLSFHQCSIPSSPQLQMLTVALLPYHTVPPAMWREGSQEGDKWDYWQYVGGPGLYTLMCSAG